MKILHAATALLILSLAVPAAAHEGTHFVKMAGRESVDVAAVAEQAGGSDVIFVGEAHDNELQHLQQMELIRALHARKLPLAFGIEMFTCDGQKHLDDWVQGKVEEEAFRKIYYSYWSYDWNLYRDLFLFARDNRIPMIALNVAKPVMSKVVRGGSTSLTADEKKELPPGAPWKLNAPQMENLKRIRAAFGDRPSPFPLENFAEAQALRNAAFAWNISKFRAKSPKTKVVVIAGIWRAVRSGTPEDLKKHGNHVSTVVLPQIHEIDPAKLSAEEADFVMLR